VQKLLFPLLRELCFLSIAPSARADYQPIDLSNYLNLGFTNAWFNNGNEFSSIIGTSNGNQDSPVPFQVANALDTSGQGGNNNFWFGLWGLGISSSARR
jgi:hypothetical protein